MKTALYRKYRSKRFDDVVGQQAVTDALKNQIKSGRVGHAYIFTGIRGVGKTTYAKILAKAVNCLNPSDGEPCGVCDVCVGIDNGSMLDVTEIDAASNSGVDNVRSLREETAYCPAVCSMRVYIIDEVHMLTREAFNALLKIMEEPPSHVLFILATTEVHKVPATILSRCQRFDLKRISAADIKERVLYIAGLEKIRITDGAAAMIARLADGAMRDALSLLDTCASLGAEIDEETVARLAGVADKSYLFEFAADIANRNIASMFERLAALYSRSADPARLCLELVRHYRNLVLTKVSDVSAVGDCSEEDGKKYEEQAAGSKLGDLLNTMSALSDTADKMTLSTDRTLTLELCLVKLCSGDAKDADQDGDDVPWSAPQTKKAAPQTKKTESRAQTAQPKKKADPEKPKPTQPQNDDADGQVFEDWDKIVESLRTSNGMLYGFLVKSRAYITDTHVLIDADEFFLKHMRENAEAKEAIKSAIADVSGIRLPIGPYVQSPVQQILMDDESDELDDIDDLISRAKKGGVDVEVK